MHSLEHGHTILWYDDSIKKGSEAYQQIQQIGDKLGLDSYFIAAPWTAGDGRSFPSGKHIALTHWTGPKDQDGCHAVLRQAQRPGDRGLLEEVPQDRRPGAGCHLTTADIEGVRSGPCGRIA